MRNDVFAVLLLGGASCLPGQAHTAPTQASVLAGWAPYVEARLWEAYDGIPIQQFESDWAVGFAPRAGRNVMFQRNRIEAGVEKGPWRLAFEFRQEAALRTTGETMQLVHRYKQRIKLATPTTFDVDAAAEGWSAKGLRASRWFELPAPGARAPRLNLALALYGTPRVRDNTLSGQVAGGPADEYTFRVAQTDVNSRYRYPFMSEKFGGSGASVSAALEWPLSDDTRLKLKLDDLWSRMTWRNVPRTQQSVDSAVAHYDEQGYINYRPLLSGQNSQVSKTAAIRRSGAAALESRFGAWGAALQIERYAGTTIPTVTGSHQFGWGKLSASVETRFRTLGLAVERGDFHVALQADRLKLSEAKSIGLNLGYRYQF
ncbi:hypothetical protein ACFDR9_001643 [Janthinobacterium sp. CG_23.3]|uniref:hypothetical protein n=1 Tax=Janthinobacterium sp. CG_23.3 TaxID=3349634 RepID=UPI0038D3C916